MKNNAPLCFRDKIEKFFQFLIDKSIFCYMLSNNSEFELEYGSKSSEKIKILTGFDSSNVLMIFSISKEFQKKKLICITDARYEIAVKIYFEKMNLENTHFELIIQNSKDKILLYNFYEDILFEEKFFSNHCIEQIFSEKLNFIGSRENVVESFLKIQDPQYSFQQNLEKAFAYEEKFSGESAQNKFSKILNAFCDSKIEFYLFNDPRSICWMLNIRGNDIAYNPLFLCFAILNISDQKLEIFCEKPEFLAGDLINLDAYEINNLEKFYERLEFLKKSFAMLSMQKQSSIFLSNFKNDNLDFFDDPCVKLMALKNQTEILGSKKAHLADSLALSNLYIWMNYLSEIEKDQLSEILISKKLVEFKKEAANSLQLSFFSESFETISAFEGHGAMIHYHSEYGDEKNNISKKNGLLLLDCGSHYFGGTTDITRIFLINDHKPTIEQVKNYTICLKSHLSLFLTKFPKNTLLRNIAAISSSNLWKNQLICPHGIGHGVSNFLGVHEGPYNISQNSNMPLLPNVIFSNEPGIYFVGEYGIRIENLMLSKICENNENFIEFENLTQFFYELKLIDLEKLDTPEKNFIKNYHEQIYEQISKYLDSNSLKIIYENFVNPRLFEKRTYNLDSLRQSLCTKNFNFIFFEKTDSTNDQMMNLIKKSENSSCHKFIILADEQTKGRGKVGNSWDSKENIGIYLTTCYKIKEVSYKFLPQISLITALIITQILESQLSYKWKDSKIQIKWPNDILINEKKVSGILPEIFMNHLIIGIGVNFFENENPEREFLSHYISYDFHKLIELIIFDLFAILDKFFTSGYQENFLKYEIFPKINSRLFKFTRFGEISRLIEDGSVDVFLKDKPGEIENFKNAFYGG